MNLGPSPEDTIAAVATPLGEGGLAVVRISGRQALAIADQVFRPAGSRSVVPSAAPSHTVHYGFLAPQGVRVDEVLLTVLRAPRTYTREDTVEISCHGGVVVTRQVLEAVLAAGARLAEPGEFTQRAFLNGRIDLTQAEAVADLIHARTRLAASAALEQLGGRLSQRVRAIREDLVNLLAHLEAHIDFPDEDIAPDTHDRMLHRLEAAATSLQSLRATARDGRILRRGIRVAILGRPNAGKSSLLNLLLGHERAIVSAQPGTTRDTLEETADIRGIPVVFVDTAGLRETVDDIEAEGVRRSRLAGESAELILHVVDGSEPMHPDDAALRDEWAQRPVLRVRNKCDLPPQLKPADFPDAISLSTTTGEGLEALKDSLERLVWSGGVVAENLPVAVNARQADALARGEAGVRRAEAALRSQASLEWVALDLRIALGAIGEIVGQTTTDDLLDSIFRQFCLGK
ncbi:MAG: tRNA uridine-5-carboxymethylaminomethyl(34) synthesis GTPase MnmE [Verrucomicrobia bacterium]|nr:tRNA uridine-5-carboxymethylaminomethyl(34) synthesis GTPase MnmE [Verrucomicrobiota bacterium]